MKKSVFLVLALILSKFAIAQQNQRDLFQSKLFYKASYANEVNEFQSIIIREFLKDTLIHQQNFKKYKRLEFTDWDKEKSISFYYESFDKDKYQRLNKDFKIEHAFYLNQNHQKGILFGIETNLGMSYEDTQNSYPKDSLIPTAKTPQKFYSIEEPDNYLILSSFFQSNLLEFNESVYTKYLTDDIYWNISQNLDNGLKTNNFFTNQIGDEIQLVYRRKWYDETSGDAVYENKQFKNFKIVGIQKEKDLIRIQLKINGFNFLSGFEDQEQDWEILVKDNSYQLDYMRIPIQTYGQELKIDNQVLKMQLVTEDFIGSEKFPFVKSVYSGEYYQPTLVPFFPMVYYNVGNVEGYISYVKLNGKEYGEKLQNSFLTSETGIWSINVIDKEWVEVRFYVAEKSKIEIELGAQRPLKKVFSEKLKEGEYTKRFKIENYQANTYYQLHLNYDSGSIGSGFHTD